MLIQGICISVTTILWPSPGVSGGAPVRIRVTVVMAWVTFSLAMLQPTEPRCHRHASLLCRNRRLPLALVLTEAGSFYSTFYGMFMCDHLQCQILIQSNVVCLKSPYGRGALQMATVNIMILHIAISTKHTQLNSTTTHRWYTKGKKLKAYLYPRFLK